MAYDPELNLLYIGVGNGSPWNRYIRSPGGGDNLYLSSIVAVNPDDGTMAWYYQTTPGDTWDYTATQHMILADLQIDGVTRKVIMQAPKNGFFYVIDRTNGEFISAEAYVQVTWATRVDQETGRPVENPDAQYANEPKTHSSVAVWRTQLASDDVQPDDRARLHPGARPRVQIRSEQRVQVSTRFSGTSAVDTDLMIPAKTVEGQIQALHNVGGHLSAWDPVKQKEVWRVDHKTSWNGGLLSTAGNLVFQGLLRRHVRGLRRRHRQARLVDAGSQRHHRAADFLFGGRRTVHRRRGGLGRRIRARIRRSEASRQRAH